jgi:hypothetical protein
MLTFMGGYYHAAISGLVMEVQFVVAGTSAAGYPM